MNMTPSVTQRVCILETYIKEKSYNKGNRIFKGRFLCLSVPFAINVPDNFCCDNKILNWFCEAECKCQSRATANLFYR